MNRDRRGRRRAVALLGVGLATGVRAQGAAPAPAPALSGPVNDAARGEQAAPPVGARIALPPATLLDGRVLDASAWRGKVLVAVLWASWCPFCARTLPLIDALYRRERAAGLEVLGLNIDRQPGDAIAYLLRRGYAFASARFDAPWRAALGKPKGLPIVWAIGRDERLKQVVRGEMFAEDVDELARWLG